MTSHSDGDSSFRHAPLDETSTIRLVSFMSRSTPTDIHLSLEHKHNYFEGGRYTALSYCWGASIPRRAVTVNDRPFAVTLNLWAALSAIREHHGATGQDKHYWIDAICLNQMDTREKNAAVPEMWRIYAAAEAVCAWLGPVHEFENTSLAVGAIEQVAARCSHDSLETCNSQWRSDQVCNQQPRSSFAECSAMGALCNRDYFDRAWIRPECAQARNLTFLVGPYSFPATSLLHYLWARRLPPEPPSYRKVIDLLNKQDVYFGLYQDGPSAGDLLASTIEQYSRAKCSDFHDRIYAFYGDPRVLKLDLTKRPRPDYGIDREELALQVIMWFDHLAPDDDALQEMMRLPSSLLRKHCLPPSALEFLDN